MMVLNGAFRLTAEQVAAATMARDNEHKKYSSLSDELRSDENSREDFIDENADTHNFNEAMIVGIQFVPEPSEGNSLLINNTSCYTFTWNLK